MPVTYKCPSCGAAMEFDPQTQTLLCPQCATMIKVTDYVSQEEQHGNMDGSSAGTANANFSDASAEEDRNRQERMKVKIYHCQSCGAELITDEYTSAVMCSFCGNPSLVEDRLEGVYKPSKVIPFKIGIDEAKQIYSSWTKKGLLTPSELESSSTIEKITGVYAPFWLYDYHGDDSMRASATNVHTSRRGDTEYIYTDHYDVYRNLEATFRRIPADASEKMPDDAMDKLEPFNYNEMVPFEMPYLSGYVSERYNYTDADMEVRVRKRAEQYITEATRDTIVGYENVTVTGNHINLQNINNEYVLFPVWMLSCRYKDKTFQFMLNGQTGKIVADRPISVTKAAIWGIGIFVVSLIIMMFGGLLIL